MKTQSINGAANITTLEYHPAAADLRLKEIKHTLTGNVALSKHVYGYKPAGNIESWAQTLGTSAAKTWAIAYDKADQLEAATQTQSGAVTAQQAFRFDRNGNITSKQDGSEISKSTHNNRNQLTAREPGGWMRVRGTTNEGASVKVKSNANPFTNAATTTADEFSVWVETGPGQNTLSIEATDDSPNSNKKTSSYTVNVTGQSRVPSYDLNGNMTANGLGQTYLWDAENRLVKITYADNSKTEFIYDGLFRRVRITERNASNTITGDKRYLWSGGNQPAEEREANGTTVTKRYFPQGEQRIGGADAGFYHYTKDHLGSVREITNSSGALVTRYDFDLWGKRTKLSGSMETDVGFTGHHHHAKSGLVLTWFRAYDADAGTWLSADPLGEAGGLNLYGYVSGDPINGWDPLGLSDTWEWGGWIDYTGIGTIIHIAFDMTAVPVEGFHALADTAEKGFDGGRARVRECDAIENGHTPLHAFGDEAATRLPEFRDSAIEAAEKMPNTSFTGPVEGAIMSADSAILSGLQLSSAMRQASNFTHISNVASRFSGFKNSMTSMGYKWVPNKNTQFGGYFRRPDGNPGNLPSPAALNESMKSCD